MLIFLALTHISLALSYGKGIYGRGQYGIGSEPTTTSASGTGAGGKKYSAQPDLLLSQNLIKVEIKQGETKTVELKINNTGSFSQAVSIDLQDLKQFILIKEPSFILRPYEEKTLALHFTAPHTESPGLYLGNIIVRSEYAQKRLSVIIEVLERKALFDVMVNIREEFKQVELGKEIEADIMMYNLGDLMPVDVTLSYAIKDFKGNTFNPKQETFAVEEQKKVTKKITVPKHLQPDFYVFYALLEYGEQKAVSTDIFEIKEKIEEKKFPSLEYLSIFIIGILFLIIVILSYRKKIKELSIPERVIKKVQQIRKGITKKRVESKKPKFDKVKFINNIEKKKIESYIKQKLKGGYTEQEVMEAAKKSGWNEELVSVLLGEVKEKHQTKDLEKQKEKINLSWKGLLGK